MIQAAEAPYKTIPISASINLMKFFGEQMMKKILISHKAFPEKALKEDRIYFF